MNRVYLNTFFLLIILVLSHVLVWYMDRDLHKARVVRHEEIKKTTYPLLKTERLQIQKEQRDRLNNWSKERNGFVQMPIDRAFDYYLRLQK